MIERFPYTFFVRHFCYLFICKKDKKIAEIKDKCKKLFIYLAKKYDKINQRNPLVGLVALLGAAIGGTKV